MSASTISREVLGNGGRGQVPGSGRGLCSVVASGQTEGDQARHLTAHWPRWSRRSLEEELVTAADRGLAEKIECPDGQMQVSHESIYRSLFACKRAAACARS